MFAIQSSRKWPRASTIQRIESGAICCSCRNFLPERQEGGTGARQCLACIERQLKTVVMAFDFDLVTDTHVVQFFEADGMTALPWTGRYKTQEHLSRMVNSSYQPMSVESKLERQLFAKRQGTVKLRLTPASTTV